MAARPGLLQLLYSRQVRYHDHGSEGYFDQRIPNARNGHWHRDSHCTVISG
jgi:hypothetical protein